jgi:uncharacterized protein
MNTVRSAVTASKRIALLAVLAMLAGCGASERAGAPETPAPAPKAQPAAAATAPATAEPALADIAITNAHEHVLGGKHLERYLTAARRLGIRRTVFVASPVLTLRGKGSKIDGMDANLNEIMEMALAHPGEIVAFAAVSQDQAEPRAALEAAVGRGARGLKLYSGHSKFHTRPLDDPKMEPVYAFAAERHLPVLWHVRLSKFGPEFERVLGAHPDLKVVLAHYGLAFWNPSQQRLDGLRRLLQSYPNLMIDTSFGSRRTLVGGLAQISKHHEAVRQLLLDYPDRFVWGTDSVVTGHAEKSVEWFEETIRANRNALERGTYYTPFAARWSRYWRKEMPASGVLHGLALPNDVLQKIYRDNPARWLDGTP